MYFLMLLITISKSRGHRMRGTSVLTRLEFWYERLVQEASHMAVVLDTFHGVKSSGGRWRRG